MKKYVKLLVVLSGGQDSTTCLYWAKEMADEVVSITFNYGQKHKVELDSAKTIAAMAGVPFNLITLGPILKGYSPLTDKSKEVPKYDSVEKLPSAGVQNTFVPARNMLFITLALNWAYVNNCEGIVLGVSQADYGGYPDCREDFIKAIEQAGNLGLDRHIELIAPLIHLTKKETVLLANDLSGCMQALSYSHTCYEGSVPPCGKCHACLLRAKGFEEAGLKDPLIRSTRW